MVRPSTIGDVARAAGVSPATVSRALRGLGRVDPQTRARVLQAAADLDYVASPTAQGLVSGRTRVVGVVVPFLARWFFATVVASLDQTLRDYGYHVLIVDLEGHHYSERHPLDPSMLSKRIDGLVMVAIHLDDAESALIDRLRIPVVAIGHGEPGWPCVTIDDAYAVVLAVDHVVALGHRRIAFVGAANTSAPGHTTPAERAEGFRRSLRAHWIEPREEWVIETDWTARGAALDAGGLLAAPEVPTAVVAGSDEIAMGVLAAARHRGMTVPGHLSVIGIDDHELSEVLGLTTVHQDVAEQGRLAALALLGELGIIDRSGERTQLVRTELVVRETTAPPRSPEALG